MRVSDRLAGSADTPHGRGDRAVRAAPAEDERLRAVRVVDLELRDVLRDPGDLLRAQPHHQVMVVRVVADVAGDVLLLQPADAVLKAGRPRNSPGPRERLLVAMVGLEVLAVGLRKPWVDRRGGRDLPEPPRPPGGGHVGAG